MASPDCRRRGRHRLRRVRRGGRVPSIGRSGRSCSKCEQPIDGIGYETVGSDGREPVTLLCCPTCLERVRQEMPDVIERHMED